MKKVLILLICLLSAVATWADTFYYSYDNQTLTYKIISNQTCIVSKCSKYAHGVLTIPRVAYYDNIGKLYLVVGIDNDAFSGCDVLSSVTIPNSVTTIGNNAFFYCSSLTSITIPNSVTTIGDKAFFECSSLTSVTIPSSVTSIGESAFSFCSSMTSVTIPNSVTTVGDRAFDSCTKLVAINVDTENQTYCSINGILFNKDKTTLSCYPAGKADLNYEIPNSVTTIGNYAFSGCSSLTSVTIPNSVTEIGYCAFQGCSSMTSVTIPNSVTTVGDRAFYGCSSLTSVTIPNSVTTINKWTFYGCSSLTSVTIPNSVTTIGGFAFEGCSGLTSVTIPNSVTTIDYEAFRDCSGLSSVSIGNSVTTIGYYAFFRCSGLSSVSIPNSVTTIGSCAFGECRGLEKVYYGASSPIAAGENVFSDYSKPTLYVKTKALNKIYITVPWGLFKNIETYDFADITLDSNSLSLYVGDSSELKVVTGGNLSELAWTSSNPEVATVDSNGTVTALAVGEAVITASATDLGSNKTLSASCNVQVVEKGKYTLTYSYYSNSTATVVGLSAESLVDVVIPEGTEKDGTQHTVTGIDASAFAGNSLLRSVTIPSTVNSIAPGAFKGCANLETVNYYPVSVNTTNDHHANPIFSDCPKFKNLNIGETVKEISKFIFKSTNIETVDIPDNVEALRNDCFADCYYLSDIKIGRGVTTIDCAAFAFGSSSDLSTKLYCNSREITYYRGLNGSTSSYMPFDNRRVSSIEFGPDVERLADYAFSDVNPGDIYCNGTTPPVVANGNVLKSVNKSTCTLHVPAESLQLYQTAYFWKDFYNIKGDIKGAAYTLSYSFDSATSTATVAGITVQDGVDNIDVVIPEYVEHEGRRYKVTAIGEFAFSLCSSLTSITIPNTVTTIGSSPFLDCDKLVTINVGTENQNYIADNGILFNKDKTTLYCYPAGKTDFNYEIPNSVTTIDNYAFYKCSSLTSVTIPNSVTTIGTYAFYGCNGLTSVTIPNSVTTIDSNAFYGCCSLASVTIPNSVTKIGSFVFYGCSSLTSVTIPNSVTKIGAFVFYDCSSLTSAAVPNSVTIIGSCTFYGCSSLTSVTIPDSVTSIGTYAFYGCSSLTSATIPNSVNEIGMRAFMDCRGLTSVTLPSSVTSIDRYAFYGCDALEKVYYGADDPVTATEEVFTDYSKPTLYVKESAIDKIKATVPWSLFGKIEAYDFTGIENIVAEDDTPIEVYTLSGLKVGDSLEGLAPGLYVVRRGSKAEKIAIR